MHLIMKHILLYLYSVIAPPTPDIMRLILASAWHAHAKISSYPGYTPKSEACKRLAAEDPPLDCGACVADLPPINNHNGVCDAINAMSVDEQRKADEEYQVFTLFYVKNI